MENGYFYLLLILGLFYYVMVRVVVPKVVQEEVEIITQYEVEQVNNNLSKDMECFKKEIEMKMNALQQGEIEELQRLFSEELRLYKTQLEVESKKTVAMYADQCDSFKELIKGIHAAIQAIERDTDLGQPLFGYISQEDYQRFEQVVTKELIYIGDLGRRWIHIFLDILGETVKGDLDEAEDRGMDIYVGIRYKQLHFIKEYIVNYCGAEIGVADFRNASEDIEILNACRLISSYYNRDWLSQINEKFRSTKEKSPYRLVSDAKSELAELKQTLYQLKQYLLNEDRRLWYEKQFEVERSLDYLEKFDEDRFTKSYLRKNASKNTSRL